VKRHRRFGFRLHHFLHDGFPLLQTRMSGGEEIDFLFTQRNAERG
jgi:hypothetical protein